MKWYYLLTLALATTSCVKNKHDSISASFKFISPSLELDGKMLLNDSSIVFSANDSAFFSLYVYSRTKKRVKVIDHTQKNLFNPFLFSGKITSLQDFEGNEDFTSTEHRLNDLISGKSIEKIVSFKNGNLLFLQVKDARTIYLINSMKGTKRVIANHAEKLHGIDYCPAKDFFVVSFDDTLVCVRANSQVIAPIDNLPMGEKLNPFIDQGQLYFVSNDTSEYYKIFSINLSDKNSRASIVYETNRDLRMPKTDGEYLYFLEIVNSEYLLRRLSLVTRKIDSITDRGVVYNYEILNENEIAIIYSDLFHAKCLMIYSHLTDSMLNVTSSSVDHQVSVNILIQDNGSSMAYSLRPPSNVKVMGTVLYFHPGLHSDFSPRWDPILINLAQNGYHIVAPNYPMSFGYGKSYYNASLSESLDDLYQWKKSISQKYDTPLYFLSSSSGNLLMESLLAIDQKDVMAAVSLFGVPREESKMDILVPTLYILGENDPYISFYQRYQMINESKSFSMAKIKSYPHEGHWFRKMRNIKDASLLIMEHFHAN
jgi:hypothetical protein